jgi:predicted nucleic acid-binding Zn ribbon protein
MPRMKAGAPEKIGAIVDSVLGQRGYLTPCRELSVVHDWPKLVGDRLAGITECTRVDRGTLFVRVASAPWRQEINFMKQHLLHKISTETQCTTIKDIVFY